MANMNIKTEKILSPSNIKRIIMLGISLRDELSNMELGLISDYDNTKTYTRGQAVYYNNYLYKCLYTTTGDFDESKWQLIGDNLSLITKQDIEAMINLSDEDIKTLQSLISTEIRLDKCFSSSDTYNRLLTVENECKKFTLEQLAKKAGVVYKVVADTTGVDSTEFLYLISNGSNGYNIYAYIDGSAVKISDTNINLDSYAKLSDLNNFVKKADADGKYATITTVDGKVDKTSILSTISSTPSNDNLLSEKVINDTFVKKTEIDNKVDKTNIVTSISSSSTDAQVPSALSVYNNIIKDKLGNFGLDCTYSLSDSMNVKLTHFGAYKFNSPTKGVPSDNVGDWVLINIPWLITDISNCTTSMRYANQLLFSPRKSNVFWYRIVWNYNESSYTYTEGDYSVFRKWNKTCMTSVEDMPKTQIKLNNGFTGFLNYEVKNGVCYVNLDAFKSEKTGEDLIVSDTLLPKPSIGTVTSAIHFDRTEAKTGMVYILANTDNRLRMHCYRDNTKGWCTFSYPVAES